MNATMKPADIALEYLRTRGALEKLATPVSLLMGDPRHAAVLRQRRDAAEARSRRHWLPGIPFALLSSLNLR